MGKPHRRSKSKYNNKYKVPNERADEIWSLSNKALVSRVNTEYNNWIMSEVYRKDDMGLCRLKDQIKQEEAAIKEDPEYIKLEEEFTRRKEELVTEELAKWKEELKNMAQPFNEEVAMFKNIFKLAMDELTRRKQEGLLKLDLDQL
jgi:hypothetical protein